ncbi:MAG: hypothetical protein ACSLFR_02860 [Solirubrobacteraceae bacterium]
MTRGSLLALLAAGLALGVAAAAAPAATSWCSESGDQCWGTNLPNHGRGEYELESPGPEPSTFRVR